MYSTQRRHEAEFHNTCGKGGQHEKETSLVLTLTFVFQISSQRATLIQLLSVVQCISLPYPTPYQHLLKQSESNLYRRRKSNYAKAKRDCQTSDPAWRSQFYTAKISTQCRGRMWHTTALHHLVATALHGTNVNCCALLATQTASPISTRTMPDTVRSGWSTFSPSAMAVAAVNTSDSALHTGTAVDISGEKAPRTA